MERRPASYRTYDTAASGAETREVHRSDLRAKPAPRRPWSQTRLLRHPLGEQAQNLKPRGRWRIADAVEDGKLVRSPRHAIQDVPDVSRSLNASIRRSRFRRAPVHPEAPTAFRMSRAGCDDVDKPQRRAGRMKGCRAWRVELRLGAFAISTACPRSSHFASLPPSRRPHGASLPPGTAVARTSRVARAALRSFGLRRL